MPKNESYALKFGGALKIECFALLEMTELGIYQALNMCRKTLQPNRRLMTKRWELAHRNLGKGGCGIDKSVETTVASERLYRIGSKQLSSLGFIVENSYTIAMAFLPNIFTSLIVMNNFLVASNLLLVTRRSSVGVFSGIRTVQIGIKNFNTL